MTIQPRPDRQKQNALLKILQIASSKSAQVVMYTSALGAISLIPRASIPQTLAGVAGGIGVNLLSNIIERVANGEKISNAEVLEKVQTAIETSKINELLTSNEYQWAIGRLFRRLDLLNYNVQRSEINLAGQLTEQLGQYQVIIHELHGDLSGIRKQPETIATREQSDEVIRLLNRILLLLDEKGPSSSEPKPLKKLGRDLPSEDPIDNALELVARGDYSGAFKLLEAASEAEPGRALVHYNLGLIYFGGDSKSLRMNNRKLFAETIRVYLSCR